MSRFDERDQFEGMPYRPYIEHVDTTLVQPPDGEYDDDAETEAFLAEQRPSRFKTFTSEKLNVPSQSRMPKTEALSIVRRLKGTIIAGSLVAFGLLSALVATHTVSASSQPTSTTPTTPNNSAGTTPGSSSPSSGGSYFQQQQGGGYGFGNNANNGSGFGRSSSVSGSQAS